MGPLLSVALQDWVVLRSLHDLIFQRCFSVLDDFLRQQCAEQWKDVVGFFFYIGSGSRRGRRDGDLKSFIYIEPL